MTAPSDRLMCRHREVKGDDATGLWACVRCGEPFLRAALAATNPSEPDLAALREALDDVGYTDPHIVDPILHAFALRADANPEPVRDGLPPADEAPHFPPLIDAVWHSVRELEHWRTAGEFEDALHANGVCLSRTPEAKR